MSDSSKHTNYSEHVFSFRVPLSYIDIGGVIYNGKYLDIYNQARDAYLRDIGFSYKRLNNETNHHFSVAEVNIKYKKPVHYDEIIKIFTKVKKFGRTSLVFEQIMYLYDSNQVQNLCNIAEFVMVCTNTSRKPEPLPEEFVAAVKLYKA